MDARQNIWFAALLVVSAITGCGGGDSDGGDTDDAGNTSPVVTQTLTLAGDDTGLIGAEADLAYFAFRDIIFSVESPFLIATNSGVALDLVRSGLDELQYDDSDLIQFEDELLNAVIFSVSEFGVSAVIGVDGQLWEYSLTCNLSCDEIMFDIENRTVFIAGAVLEPAFDAENLATADLTVDGILTWTEADEDPEAPAAAL